MRDNLPKMLRAAAKEWREKNKVVSTGATRYDFALEEAADAIEELMKAAKAMHTWIFLNTGDEQKAYDECGLSDEMNAALGYGGQFVAELPKEG